MAICDRGTWFSRMNLAAAMAALDEALFTEPRTRRVASSSKVKTADFAWALADDDHGQSVLSKKDSSVALRRMTVCAMT